MADNKAGEEAANNTSNNNPNGTAPDNKTVTDTSGNVVDTSKFTEADWEKVYASKELYNHPRFKALNDRATQAKKLEDEKKAAEEEALKKNQEFEKLAKVKEEEANTWKSKAENAEINNAIAFEAQKLGVTDPTDVLKLIDRGAIKLNEDGTVTGAAETVKALVDAKPYLKGKGGGSSASLGGGTNPGNTDTTTPRFKLSQIRDHRFYQEHAKEIDAAYKLGLIENDLGRSAGGPNSQ